MADIDTKIRAQGGEDRRVHVRSVMIRLTELLTNLQPHLNDADCQTKRRIVRALFNALRLGQRKLRLSSVCRRRRAPGFGADYGDVVPSVN